MSQEIFNLEGDGWFHSQLTEGEVVQELLSFVVNEFDNEKITIHDINGDEWTATITVEVSRKES
jgi:hypothetical protein